MRTEAWSTVLVVLALSAAGCIGTVPEDEPATGEELAPASEETQHPVTRVDRTTTLVIDVVATECADLAPRCGGHVSDGPPPSIPVRVFDYEGSTATLAVGATWNASTPLSQELALTVRSQQTQEEVAALSGTSPLNGTVDVEPGDYLVSIGPSPEPAVGAAVDQEIDLWVEGPISEQG